jgi:hypothetical protein
LMLCKANIFMQWNITRFYYCVRLSAAEIVIEWLIGWSSLCVSFCSIAVSNNDFCNKQLMSVTR